MKSRTRAGAVLHELAVIRVNCKSPHIIANFLTDLVMSWPLLLLLLPLPSLPITCWKCASHNAQWGCLDPFDFQPFVQVSP